MCLYRRRQPRRCPRQSSRQSPFGRKDRGRRGRAVHGFPNCGAGGDWGERPSCEGRHEKVWNGTYDCSSFMTIGHLFGAVKPNLSSLTKPTESIVTQKRTPRSKVGVFGKASVCM